VSDKVKPSEQVKEGGQKANDRLEKPPDALDVRNAPNDALDAALAQNQCRTKGMTELAYKDGFVDSPDKRSFELLVAVDPKTGKELTIDKNSPKAKKDISLDPHPTRITPAMTAEAEAVIRAKKEAPDKPATKKSKGKEAIADTGTLKAITEDPTLPKDSRDLAGFYQQMRTASKARGHSTNEIDKAATEALAPELNALRGRDPEKILAEFKANNPSNPADNPYAASDRLPVPKSMLEGYVSEPEYAQENWLAVAEKIAQLPMDKQLQVIGSGLMAGIEQYQHDERERTLGRLIGTVEGTGEVLQGLAKIADFGAACILGDNERAGKMGEEFGAAVGQTIVGGVRLFQAADQYLYEIGYTGDYAKPFRDIAAAGQALNEQWSQLPPREQERVKAKLITELIAGGAIGAGGAGSIQKTSKFTDILDTIAIEAKALQAATKPKIKQSVRAISNAVDELIQPMGDTGMGVKMPIPKDPMKDETKMLMSKADDLGDRSRPNHPEEGMRGEPVEKYTPPKWFAAELTRILERLSPGERTFIADHSIKIKPIRMVQDKFPQKAHLGACYDRSENTIYVPEQVLKFGKPVPNYDLEFAFRHEFGHAFNAKSDSLGQYISELPEFRAALRQDIKHISAEKLEDMQLSYPKIEELRDEVFADMYAHATGLQSNNPRSMQMKELFPNCLKYAKTRLL